MLFFASFDEMNKQCHSYRKNMSLQVHDPLLARRAHPCTSSLPASMTVEAALVLPLACFSFWHFSNQLSGLTGRERFRLPWSGLARRSVNMGFWRSRWKPETVSCRHSVRTLRQLFGSGKSRAVRGSCDGEKGRCIRRER